MAFVRYHDARSNREPLDGLIGSRYAEYGLLGLLFGRYSPDVLGLAYILTLDMLPARDGRAAEYYAFLLWPVTRSLRFRQAKRDRIPFWASTYCRPACCIGGERPPWF